MDPLGTLGKFDNERRVTRIFEQYIYRQGVKCGTLPLDIINLILDLKTGTVCFGRSFTGEGSRGDVASVEGCVRRRDDGRGRVGSVSDVRTVEPWNVNEKGDGPNEEDRDPDRGEGHGTSRIDFTVVKFF